MEGVDWRAGRRANETNETVGTPGSGDARASEQLEYPRQRLEPSTRNEYTSTLEH